MADIPVSSIELESNAHPDEDHSTLPGNTRSKRSVVITISERKIFIKN